MIPQSIIGSLLFLLNKKNVLITKDIIENTLKNYNITYKVKNVKLFILAFSHNSYVIDSKYLKDYKYCDIIKQFNKEYKEYKNIVSIQENSYERLEFLGDAIIKPIITKYIYDRFPEQQEGFMSNLRTRIESTETLAKFIKALGFDKYILLAKDFEKNNARIINKNILEDCFEAFIGALYLDGEANNDVGYIYNLIKNFVINLIESELDISSLINNEINYKDELIKFCHNKVFPDPVYGVVKVQKEFNKENMRIFDVAIYTMCVKVNGSIAGEGCGTSKKEGEQNAAKNALIKLNDTTDDVEYESEYVIE